MKKKVFQTLLLLSLYLGLHNGYIALWNAAADEPVHVFPYRAELYPNADQKALSKGIPVSDDKQLRRLLEDFLS